MNYGEVIQRRNEIREKNDCGIISVTMATGIAYDTVRDLYAHHGRKTGKGVTHGMIDSVVTALGYRRVLIPWDMFSARTVLGFEREVAEGTFLIHVPGHVLCFKDGVVHDWTRDRKHRIISVYAVVPAGEEYTPSIVKRECKVEGRVTHKVHEVAEKYWKDWGMPLEGAMFKSVVKAARAFLIKDLGIHPTTVSVQLSAWKKKKLAGE